MMPFDLWVAAFVMIVFGLAALKIVLALIFYKEEPGDV
jgi:hypothetical protein